MRHLDVEFAHRFVQGRLAVEALQRWSSHLATCADCRKLVDEERNWKNLLELDEAPARPRGAIERVLARIEALAPQRAARRRRQRLAAAAGYVVAAAIIVGVAWSFEAAPRETQRIADSLGISTAFQSEVISNLNALETLESEPWLARDYVTVDALQKLIDEERP